MNQKSKKNHDNKCYPERSVFESDITKLKSVLLFTTPRALSSNIQVLTEF